MEQKTKILMSENQETRQNSRSHKKKKKKKFAKGATRS